MMEARIVKNKLEKLEKDFFEAMQREYKITTNDCLELTNNYGEKETFIIFEGKEEKQHMCRDCGTYYEVSTPYVTLIIDKENMQIKAR